jgi:DHA2 family multidrug resistance protein
MVVGQGDDDLVEYGFRRFIITITVLCALLEIVDTTIVNVALTNMRESWCNINWCCLVITAYAIANVIVIPMTSWLSQQFGRRNYFAVSIIIFTVASFYMVMLQIYGADLPFYSRSWRWRSISNGTNDYYWELPNSKEMAQAIYGMGVIVGPTLGPPLGGYIVDRFSCYIHQYSFRIIATLWL